MLRYRMIFMYTDNPMAVWHVSRNLKNYSSKVSKTAKKE